MNSTSATPDRATSLVQNIFHHDADNVGDRLCGPANYFLQGQMIKENLRSPIRPKDRTIFGGGQIFGQISSATIAAEGASLVAWGVGIPRKGVKDREVRNVTARFDLFGTRNFEWSDELDFVPCVSCMSGIFDDLPAPTHDVVVYGHRSKAPDLKVPKGVPFLTNRNQPPEDAARFLASGETIVTSSYHGVYWAQLIGRKVICIPFNDKFRTFQYPPCYSTTDRWMHDLHLGSRTDPLLEEYREINRQFFMKVARRWDLATEKDSL
mgnify:CR=1 FL=1